MNTNGSKYNQETNINQITSSKAAADNHHQQLQWHGTISQTQINSNYNIIIGNLMNQSHFAVSRHAAQLRNYCSNSSHQRRQEEEKQQLTHVDAKGKATMVDVSAKTTTIREAAAVATVVVGPRIAQLIHSNSLAKGDVLSIAQIAGIVGAKKTSELIPLCHNITLSSVKVSATLDHERHCVQLCARVRCVGQTGVEMEALTACATAALTVYDMCKAVSHDITIKDIRLWSKSGGKRDFQRYENKHDDAQVNGK